MKFNFRIQEYQTRAVDSVVQVFRGQSNQSGIKYRIDPGKRKKEEAGQTAMAQFELGFKNHELELSKEELLRNIKTIQDNNHIRISDSLVKGQGVCSLDIEMETGTGKTYVYIKTMYELNKYYGWSKFIVVVPSIAIREGVKKSFEMTEEHFMEQYGKKIRYFVYDSKNLNQIETYSSDAGINVMIINTQAFNTSLKEGAKNSAARIIYSERDDFSSRRPIDVIKANNPILILDEPQKMGGQATQTALKNFNPLFSINYSATHAKEHNLVYALDAVDAFNERLVKKIEVKGFQVKNLRGTDIYLYLDEIILSDKKPPTARMEIEVKNANSIKRTMRIFFVGDNLYEISKNMEQYKGYTIAEIDPRNNKIIFTNGEEISKGDVSGDASEKDLRLIQIRETIKSHFEKENELFNQGIKTLSLFFIDEVAKYRQYDEDGNELLGEYGKIFEREYNSILNQYIGLFDDDYVKYLKSIDVHDTHKGYFSIDKNGRAINSSENKDKISDDISAYDLILKNKERLLSFEEPTRFIFSHSALREGWDNPNVFQICTLKHGKSVTMKRQEVGRGLRLCVNRDGFRMDAKALGRDGVHELNKLTVIASESYQSFVEDLQKDTKKNLRDRPTKANSDYFVGKVVLRDGEKHKLTTQEATMCYQYLVKNEYVSSDGEDSITEKYHDDLENNTLAELPEPLKDIEEGIHRLVQGIFSDSDIENMFDDGHKTKVLDNDLNDNFYKKEFQALWKNINHKYAYIVSFDSDELINKSIRAIDENLYVARLQYTVSSSEQKDELTVADFKEGFLFKAAKSSTHDINNTERSSIEYDLIGKIAENTVLTRRTVVKILKGIEPYKFSMYKENPEEFISSVSRLINEQKATIIVEHISYDETEGKYDNSIFTAEKNGTLDRAFKAKKHIKPYVFTDGNAEKSVERRFAEDLDGAEEVCVYAKLPRGFAIPTPVGNYSPDWAIAFNAGTVKHIFFIAETKGSMESLQLRPIEKAKISCAKKLFNEISTEDVVYHDVNSYEALLNIMPKINKTVKK